MSSLAGLPSRKCLVMNFPFMPGVYDLAYRFAAALGIGLLIGAERERRKGEGPSRSPAGIRTFMIASLSGGVSLALGGVPLLAITFLGVAGLCAIGYMRTEEQDPGLTTETALLLSVLLGGFATASDNVSWSSWLVCNRIHAHRRAGPWSDHRNRSLAERTARRICPERAGNRFGPGGDSSYRAH